MAFIIRNIDTVDVSIDDIGITLAPGEDYDLAQDEANTVATSTDLPAAITAGQIRVLELLDGSPRTVLSEAQSLEIVSVHNEPHYRIRGGILNQLDDVLVGGSPLETSYLRHDGTQWTNLTAAAIGDFVHLTGDEDVAGEKRFVDSVRIGGSAVADLQLTFNGPDGPASGYAIRQVGLGSPQVFPGTLFFMDTAAFPQILMGSDDAETVAAFVDVDNDGTLFLNSLHTGPVTIGPGGLLPDDPDTAIGSATDQWGVLHLDDEIRFYDNTGGSPLTYVSLAAPASVSSSITWTLPSTDSVGSQALVSDGAGNLDWATIPSLGSPIVGLGDVDRVQYIHVGKHGNDSNDGLTPNKAKLTFTSAISATATGSPAATRYTILCEDAGTYSESFTVPAYVTIEARDATISGTVTVSDDSEFTIREVIAATNDSAIIKTSGSASARVTAEILRSTGTGNTVATQSGELGVLLVLTRQLFVEDGSGVFDESTSPTGHIHVEIEDLYITGTGSGLDRNSNTGLIVGRVAHILEIGGGVGNGTAIEVDSGRVDILAGFIDTTTAYNVSGSGTLKVLVNVMNGTRIQTSGSAVVDVIESNVLRWLTITSADSPFTPRRIGYLAIDTSSGPITLTLPYPPSDGDNISFFDALGTFGTNNLTVHGNGAVIQDAAGSPSQVVFNINSASGIFIYNAVLGAWTFNRIQEEVGVSPSTVIYVSKNGDDILGDGSFSNPFLTVKKGAQEASSRALGSPRSPVTVKIFDGVYEEDNPIFLTGTNSELINIQGEQEDSVVIKPINAGSVLFDLESDVSDDGPSLNRMKLEGNSTYRSTPGSSMVRITGDGRFVLNAVNITEAYIGLDTGNGVISTNNETVYDFATISNCATGIDVKSTVKQAIQVAFFRENDIAVYGHDDAIIEAGSWFVQGAEIGDPATGTGVVLENNALSTGSSVVIQNLTLGIQVNDTSEIRLGSAFIRDNTTDFEQADATARVAIQGRLSKTKQLIADGAIVSLNYVDTDTGDFIVGNAESTGDPGQEFRVRDADGRIAIGDQATDAHIASGGVGGSRTINIIDENGNVRIWRYTAADGEDPAFEWIKGVNDANTDDGGDVPIVSIAAATDTITIDVSGTDYNDPFDPTPGIDRETLAERAFPAGREFRVNGTASNNANYTVSSATYTGGSPDPQTIEIVVTANITVSEGAGGEVVFGGGAGRPDGVSTYVGDPGAAVAAGTGNVWWDMFLQEDDYFVIRHRTGGSGVVDNEKARIFPDRSEWLGALDYDDGDSNEILVIQHVTGGSNYLTINNAATGNGPEIVATGEANTDIEMIPAGTGTVVVPAGYEANVTDDSLITKAYADSAYIVSGSPATVIPEIKAHLYRHNGATTQTFGGTPILVNFGTNVRTDSDYSHAIVTGGSQITINASGWYKIEYEVGVDNGNNSRSTAATGVFVNSTLVVHSLGYSYHRNAASGEGVCFGTIKLNLTATDTVDVQIAQLAGGGALTTIANSCRLNIEGIDGP